MNEFGAVVRSRNRTGMWVTCSHALAVELVRDRRFRVRNSADRVGAVLGELDPGLACCLMLHIFAIRVMVTTPEQVRQATSKITTLTSDHARYRRNA